jgi:hypothetical protein
VTDPLELDDAQWQDALARLDGEDPLPDEIARPEVRTELRRWRPPKSQRGLVVFFTGLSGSGKSTLARALVDALLEDGRRTLTVLDGDVVRRELSRGLGFSQADRDLNVRRIGWVAAEVARHGGLAVCAPIAPYAATRAAVRAEAEAVGGLLPRARRHAAGGLRAARPQGPVRQGAGRPDPAVHRHQRPVRGTGRRRARRRTPRPSRWTTPWTASHGPATRRLDLAAPRHGGATSGAPAAT